MDYHKQKSKIENMLRASPIAKIPSEKVQISMLETVFLYTLHQLSIILLSVLFTYYFSEFFFFFFQRIRERKNQYFIDGVAIPVAQKVFWLVWRKMADTSLVC
jgi:hypothetical protein